MQEKDLLKVFDLLQIKEITTDRQKKNGTRVFKLPMKAYWRNSKYSEPVILATYKSGYVRRLLTNSGVYGGAGCYQLNKVTKGDRYYKLRNGDYRKFKMYQRTLIPNEVDRLQYLLDYDIKNWYCKPQVQTKVKEVKVLQDIDVTIDGHRYTLQENNKI